MLHLLVRFFLIIAVIGMAPNVYAKKSKQASIDEMWKIIQQQQQQIAELQAKAASSNTNQDASSSSGVVSAKDKPSNKSMIEVATIGDTSTSNSPSVSAKLKGTKSDADRKTDILASEVEKLKTQMHIPDKREYKVEYGLGPAASEIYRVNRGLSIGGYGDLFYSSANPYANNLNPYWNGSGSNATMYDARAVIYIGYKFNDWILMNSEFEFENGSTEFVP